MIALPAILQRGGEWFEISSSVSSPESCDRDRALDLLRRLNQEPGNAAILHRILAECDHTTYPYAPSHLLQTLALRIASGRLGIQRRSALLSPAPAPVGAPGTPHPAPPPPRPTARRTFEKSWIAFELLDEDGEPVAESEYRLTLPTGETRDGILDALGTAYVGDIDPGSCTISFSAPPLRRTPPRPAPVSAPRLAPAAPEIRRDRYPYAGVPR